MNNNNNHEIIFWKVFRNIYIRNIILSKIKNNNKSYNSYNGTTSLKLMIKNNKLHMILDKLKSNHHIHIDIEPDFTHSKNLYDPYFKSISTEINQLLWSKYNLKLKSLYNKNIIIKSFKLWSLDNENNYKAHSLLYTLLRNYNYYHYSSSFIQTIKYLNQQINNNKEYNKITKKQKTNHFINNNNNDNNQYFIEQLISISNSSKSSTPSTPENEIIKAIYNNQPIPTHFDIYYSNQSQIYYDQDLFENQLKVDFRSVLLNIRQHTIIYDCYNKEVLELILLKLQHHKYSIKLKAFKSRKISYPINSLLHAKIYCLNQLNRDNRKTAPKFKQYLINNQVNTLEELISVAKDTLVQNGQGFNFAKYFGDYYCYYIINSNKFDELKINNKFPNGFGVLLLKCSILTQQKELFDKLLENYKLKLIFNHDSEFQSIRNSIGNSFSNNNDINKLIKEKSTTYFNHIITQTNQLLKNKSINIKTYEDNWFHIFKLIINSYNSKLFEWLLDSNTQLKDIYYKLLGNEDYFKELFIYHSRIEAESDQLDYKMLDVLIKHIKIVENKEFKINLDFFTDNINYSTQIKVQILNHLTKSPSNIQSSTISKLIYILIADGFENLDLADEIIKVYNQIDQQQLFNYYKSNHNQYSKFLLPTYQNKSSILVKVLIKSIINLDFESINKIISATLNNKNILIPKTFNNSLDIIKYLISNKYLKEFSLYYILETIIFNIQVDKEYIIELIRLSNNEINNTATTTDELIEEIEIIYNGIDKESEQQIENETKENEKNNQLFTLSTLERIRDEFLFNTMDYEFLDETLLRYTGDNDYYNDNEDYKDRFLSRCIRIYYSNGYYNAIYQFLNNNKDIDIDFSLLYFGSHPISIEWFSKLYPVLFKDSLKLDSDRISEISYHNPPEIFEFIWNNHFSNDDERRKYILDLLLHGYEFYKLKQLIEYILKNKKEFIITTVKLNQDQIYELHIASLIIDTQLFHQVTSTFPSFKFNIKYEHIKNFNKKRFIEYDTIEYLYSNNLIPNLEQIIGTANLSNFRIEEHSDGCINSNNEINISKSTFILIHTIIKLQKEQ